MSVKVKICGLTNALDALAACELGADLVGFVLEKESPRFIEPREVKEIIKNFPEKVGKVALFKNRSLDEVVRIILDSGFDHVQLHGEESPEFCVKLREKLKISKVPITILKTFRVGDRIVGVSPDEYRESVDYLLFDTYHPAMMGGTGLKFDWNVLKRTPLSRPFFLAGGLSPGNVKDGIAQLKPYGVDVA
ncbi:MAG TPA: phosphoribosylanthranilate isomerase, partial [Candidatus Omnitrophota bacterium]|nr:phosphoribosylanthranilate isomerase [Candidatus Omnitrophota bacterium]